MRVKLSITVTTRISDARTYIKQIKMSFIDEIIQYLIYFEFLYEF